MIDTPPPHARGEAIAASDATAFGCPARGWRRKLHIVIFESDTPAGLFFDQALLVAILTSVLVVMLDSVQAVANRYHGVLNLLEWGFTLLFTAEYVARLLCVERPWRYARSFFGVVDLVSVLPTYLAVVLPELHALMDVRVLRMLRVFRILKLSEYFTEYQLLGAALSASRRKIAVFLSAVIMIVVSIGTVMYVIEGPGNGFTSIPVSVYWAISTMTTVGFGDITPQTDLGRLIASLMMLMGWGVLAVPTGIVTVELTNQQRLASQGRACRACGRRDHARDARYCQSCGERLEA
jgi:voltage-gated potassium channel